MTHRAEIEGRYGDLDGTSTYVDPRRDVVKEVDDAFGTADAGRRRATRACEALRSRPGQGCSNREHPSVRSIRFPLRSLSILTESGEGRRRDGDRIEVSGSHHIGKRALQEGLDRAGHARHRTLTYRPQIVRLLS